MKTLMKIKAAEIRKAHPTLCYFRSRSIVLCAALLVTRQLHGQNKKGIYGEWNKREMPPDEQNEREEGKKQTYLSCEHQLPSLRDKSRKGDEENIFRRHVLLNAPL